MAMKTAKRKQPGKARPSATTPQLDRLAAVVAERRALRTLRRTQREVVRLGEALEREVRKADYKLADLGARLLERARRAQRNDATGDLARETSVADRQPQSVE
jgi:hypothetical protein